MKLPIVKIGNSRGIRLPKAILDQCGFEDVLEIEVKDGTIILTAHKSNPVRKNWDKAFKSMAQAGDDELLDAEYTLLGSDDQEWTW